MLSALSFAAIRRRFSSSILTTRKQQLEKRLIEIEQGASLVRGARRLGLVKPGEHLFIVQGIQQWRRAHAKSK